MRIAALAFTEKGLLLGRQLEQRLGGDFSLIRCPEQGLADWAAQAFATAEAMLFIGAAGIAVRAIAPLVRDKTSDPAVLVLDEGGAYVIPLLSGHLGGANELARQIAALLGALPIITTATDLRGIWAVDDWARRKGLRIANPARIKWISARLLAGETIRLKSLFPIEGALPEGLLPDENEYDILITWRYRGRESALRLIPPVITVGVGCRKGIDSATLTQAYQMALAKAACHPQAVARICSIDLKSGETGLKTFCREQGLPLQCFSPEQLRAVPGSFNASEFVQKITGVDNVCERAAVLGSGGKLLSAKDAGNGVTMALGIAPYVVRFEEDGK